MKKTTLGDNRPILFLDSGIGGLPYCKYFRERNKNETVIYLADREHFPYGKRSREDLVSLLSSLIERLIKKENPKIAVLACNTATVSALDVLRQTFLDLPFVGTVPAVKPAALSTCTQRAQLPQRAQLTQRAIKSGRVGVLGTERTIEEPYIRRLAAENDCPEITGIAAPDLVEFVERRLIYADEAEKRKTVRSWLNLFRAEGIHAIVLGCTHFLFLLEEFRLEAYPDITVFDSVDGISRRIESLLDANGSVLRASNNTSDNIPSVANRMLLTGIAAPEDNWKHWAQEFGLGISLLEGS